MVLCVATNIVALSFLVWFIYGWAKSSLSGAPFVPTFSRHTNRLLKLADLESKDVLYDLGCGDGRMLIQAVRQYNIQAAIGLEISPLPLAIARLRISMSGLNERISIRKENMYTANITPATVVFIYLLTETLDKLTNQLATLRPGTRIISAAFTINTDRHPEFHLLKEEKIGLIKGYLYERI